MKKGFFTILGLAALLLAFSGCIKMSMNYDIGKDGKGNVDVTVDMKGFVETMKGMQPKDGADISEEYKKANICKTIMDREETKEQENMGALPGEITLRQEDAECTAVDDFVAKLSWKDVDFLKAGSFTVDENASPKRYKFTIKGSGAGSKEGSGSNMGLDQLKLAGMEFKLTVAMPGRITSAGAGTISLDGKSATIDFIEEADKLGSDVVIISEESGFDLGGILSNGNLSLASGIVLLIAAIGVIMIPIIGIILLRIIGK